MKSKTPIQDRIVSYLKKHKITLVSAREMSRLLDKEYGLSRTEGCIRVSMEKLVKRKYLIKYKKGGRVYYSLEKGV
jgi:DNA-binding transcriptional regulator PaaX